MITATDMSGNKTPYSYNIYVKDYSEPEITLSTPKISGKVGQEIELASYTIDNRKEKDCKCYYVIYMPDGTMKFIKDDNVFIPEEKGEYTVSICVLDKNGNLAQVRYIIKVA